ncbi:MAG: MMPL family transporter, partial [Actinomycetota bacterium]|nr:MMPL family transporter [Actinomycetota bacterium]
PGLTEVSQVVRRLQSIDGIARVVQPRAGNGLVSQDGRLALVQGQLERSVSDQSLVGERVQEAFGGDDEILVGGPAVAAVQLNERTVEDLRRIELYAFPLLLLISLLVFRSLVAAALPLLVGGLSIAFTLAALRALSEVMVIDIFALNVVTVLGLGLAIDYSLFMVSRYRQELARSGASGQALRDTVVPIGRMVAFSAATVAAAVASLAVFPQDFLASTGVGCAIVALVSAAVVLVILPAVLALLGENVNALAPRGLGAREGRSPRWRALARVTARRPALVFTAVAALMIAAGIPFLRAELTRADARVLPEADSARVVDETIRERFVADPSSSLLVVLGDRDEPGRLGDGLERLAGFPGVETVSAPRRAGELWFASAGIRDDPYADSALDLVGDARRIPWRTPALVSGTSAELADQRESLRDHLPLAVAIVLATTFAALLLMTGSVVLPLLAIVANALTISVALGVLVFVFQDGRLESLLTYSGVGALDISVPVLLFAVIFGLSTDYTVFLLSRITELRTAGVGDATAIATGLENTGGIITAAALLFAVAMGSFAFSQMIFIKEVAVGTSLAVLIDAALVRSLLLPSMMQLCGRWTWWSPKPLRRFARLRA